MTEAAVKLAQLVKRYGSLQPNPVERAGALAEGNPVAKRKSKKKRTAKQKASTKKMIAANKRARRAKRAGKTTKKRKIKRAKKKAGRRPKSRPMLTPGGVVQVPQGDAPVAARKKRRGKKRRKKTGKRKAARRKTTKRGGRRKKRRSKKRRGGGRRSKVTVTRGGKTRTVKLKGSPKVQYLIVQEKKTSGRRKKRRGGGRRKKRKGRKGRGRKRKGNPINLGHHASLQPNPGYAGGLFSNAGPFTMEKLKDLGMVAVGVGFGLMVSEIVDRLVATRKPADSDSTKANHPWYGRNAVAAIQRRPDAWRYGAQVAGVGVSLGVAYLARNLRGAGRIIPFLAGGAAVAFAAKGVMMLFNWELLPRVLKITDANEQTLANRIAVLEQTTTQDTVDTLFEKWAGVSSLANNQLETPSIQGPLSADTSQDILTLAGRQKIEGSPLGLGGRPGPLVETGRIGQCSACNAMNGCYATCPDSTKKKEGCKPCQENGGGDGGGNGGGDGRRCRYIVQPGDDIFALARAAGIDMNTVNLMNDGTPDRYWIVGRRVTLPNGICNLVRTRQPETPPPPPTVITTATPALPLQPPASRPDLPRIKSNPSSRQFRCR